MKKSFVLIAAIVAVVGLGTAVAVANETIKVKTSVSLERKSGSRPGPSSAFQGKVRAKKRSCEQGRTVTVSNGAGYKLGPDKTNNRGRYNIFVGGRYNIVVNGDDPPTGPFAAKVREMRITKDSGNTIVCKADRSKPLTLR